MEIHQLRYFVAVAEEGSFSNAAEREHVSQPSLSQQIHKLEEGTAASAALRRAREVGGQKSEDRGLLWLKATRRIVLSLSQPRESALAMFLSPVRDDWEW